MGKEPWSLGVIPDNVPKVQIPVKASIFDLVCCESRVSFDKFLFRIIIISILLRMPFTRKNFLEIVGKICGQTGLRHVRSVFLSALLLGDFWRQPRLGSSIELGCHVRSH